MAFFYGLLIAGSLLGIMLLVLIFSLLTLAQKGDCYLDKIEILAGRDFNSETPIFQADETRPKAKSGKKF